MHKRPPGRPRTGEGTRVVISMHALMLSALDAHIAAEQKSQSQLTRADTIRWLIRDGLLAKGHLPSWQADLFRLEIRRDELLDKRSKLDADLSARLTSGNDVAESRAALDVAEIELSQVRRALENAFAAAEQT